MTQNIIKNDFLHVFNLWQILTIAVYWLQSSLHKGEKLDNDRKSNVTNTSEDDWFTLTRQLQYLMRWHCVVCALCCRSTNLIWNADEIWNKRKKSPCLLSGFISLTENSNSIDSVKQYSTPKVKLSFPFYSLIPPKFDNWTSSCFWNIVCKC